ncbi:2-succinyl-5-enolpyruvyl-6-hydroxy-3-cyclohexene-1-carboxylic-acid synthase [Fulvivirga sediminis]|uniref:2-succinyl-5-enolpyruvyl-6-hydroxy-3-cyclohexene-1-carboxylate synthase n=1 Tax=Fulvivirga sediminis TaxID=2803949 RepID=A0A937JY50_9BACT|nr:2-succinyl-5-enolpyruvyl-6-hydroxy-3-cyclohexene-1-carboxylic-acid synthase [Fulvivirga sediminis]MBL3655314.1 2-succinyl-5-enolpyruvyl-6-hydroxy-3-cyclohexene-1-carboxylic-acid synthase [Fulvivirga sediminis]
MNLKPVYNIAEICAQLGVTEAILSPGSRSAPLTVAFARHKSIRCRTITDERSAAFIGMGIAQKTKRPTVLVCTSGSAAYNYAPAIAEAYFQQIPLLVITADRPSEWIDQLDGQTIRQQNIYGQHVKKSYQLPVDLDNESSEWHTYRTVSEAVNLANQFPFGPVHLNIPFREPFYPAPGEEAEYDTNIKVTNHVKNLADLPHIEWVRILEQWKTFKRILIVGGQSDANEALKPPLSKIIKEQKIPVVGDIISNLHGIDDIIKRADLFLGQDKPGLHESMHPELLVTFGKSTISKNLKLLLRKYQPLEHWHIQPSGYVADTYQSLSKVVPVTPLTFFKKIAERQHQESFDNQKQENFFYIWQIEERKAQRQTNTFFPHENWGEFECIKETIQQLPAGSHLHLANSMAVRYANYVGLENSDVEVFANRGTSGIDGSNSTTVGHCLNSDHLNILITGDLAFFYDRNAFWHNYKIPNLRILLLNNHAGGIFRIINGPSKLPELEEFFETKQQLNAKLLAQEHGFEYLNCDKKTKFKNYLKSFLEDDGIPKIMEIESDSATNTEILKTFKQTYKDLK